MSKAFLVCVKIDLPVDCGRVVVGVVVEVVVVGAEVKKTLLVLILTLMGLLVASSGLDLFFLNYSDMSAKFLYLV